MNSELLWDVLDRIADPEIVWRQGLWHACLAGHILQLDGWSVVEVPCSLEDGCEHAWYLAKGDSSIQGHKTSAVAIGLLEVTSEAMEERIKQLFHHTMTLPGLIRAIGEIDPEGAARRAAGAPQYDHDRAAEALAVPSELLVDCS